MGDQNPAAEDNTAGSPTRRAVLQGGVTTLGTALSVSGHAVATSEEGDRLSELRSKYRNKGEVEAAVAKFAGGVTSTIRAENTDLFADANDVTVRRLNPESESEETNQTSGTYVDAIRDEEGRATGHITVVRRHRGTVVRLVVEPELERAYAFVRNENGDLLDIVTADSTTVSTTADGDDIGTQGCTTSLECKGCCETLCEFGELYDVVCCDDDFPGVCYRDSTGDCCSVTYL